MSPAVATHQRRRVHTIPHKAALAFADVDAASTPGLAEAAAATLGNATAAIRLAFASYRPDGAWDEGAGYWGYGTRYALTAATSLIAATGDDHGLAEHAAGFNETGSFCLYHMGPAGGRHAVFNWADAEESPCELVNLMQLGALFPATAATNAPTARVMLDGDPDAPGHVPGAQAAKTCCVWYAGNACFACVVGLASYSAAGTVAGLDGLLPLDYHYERRAVGFFRQSWTDPNASWLGFKGGNSTAPHNDLDAGTFVLDMAGQRWAVDLGGDNYALKGYWDYGTKDGQRYSYYRKSTRGHNTLTFGGWDGHPGPSGQRVNGARMTMITEFRGGSTGGGPKHAAVDLSRAYSHQGPSSVVRSFDWNAGMTTLAITDAFGWAATGDDADHGHDATAAAAAAGLGLNLTWAMHTRAAIAITAASADAPSRAVLSQGGVELVAVLHAPAGASFTSTAVHAPSPEKATDGIFKLMVEIASPAVKAAESIRVSFTAGGASVPPPPPPPRQLLVAPEDWNANQRGMEWPPRSSA